MAIKLVNLQLQFFDALAHLQYDCFPFDTIHPPAGAWYKKNSETAA